MITQIAALPRSRTAWLSVILAIPPNATVNHELSAYDSDWMNTIKAQASSVRTGDVFIDVSTTAHLPGCALPGARRVWIRQDPECSRERCIRSLGYDPGPLDALADLGEKWVKEGRGQVFELSDLGTLNWMRILWETVNPFAQFPARSVTAMQRMDIQRRDAREAFGPNSPGVKRLLAVIRQHQEEQTGD